MTHNQPIAPTDKEHEMERNESSRPGTIAGPLTRRGFLVTSAGIVGAGAVLVACGDDNGDGNGTGADTTERDATGGASDVAVAMTAAGLEVLAVNTYGAALDAANQGALGAVPPAVAEFVTTAQQQHQVALDSWNDVLAAAGESEVTEPPSDLEQMVNDQFAEVTDVTGAAELALTLEQTAAQTYLASLPGISNTDARKLAGQLQIVDQQHGAVLLFVLGQYPVPNTFQPTEMAVT